LDVKPTTPQGNASSTAPSGVPMLPQLPSPGQMSLQAATLSGAGGGNTLASASLMHQGGGLTHQGSFSSQQHMQSMAQAEVRAGSASDLSRLRAEPPELTLRKSQHLLMRPLPPRLHAKKSRHDVNGQAMLRLSYRLLQGPWPSNNAALERADAAAIDSAVSPGDARLHAVLRDA